MHAHSQTLIYLGSQLGPYLVIHSERTYVLSFAASRDSREAREFASSQLSESNHMCILVMEVFLQKGSKIIAKLNALYCNSKYQKMVLNPGF